MTDECQQRPNHTSEIVKDCECEDTEPNDFTILCSICDVWYHGPCELTEEQKLIYSVQPSPPFVCADCETITEQSRITSSKEAAKRRRRERTKYVVPGLGEPAPPTPRRRVADHTHHDSSCESEPESEHQQSDIVETGTPASELTTVARAFTSVPTLSFEPQPNANQTSTLPTENQSNSKQCDDEINVDNVSSTGN
jgi:hypothetical protein